MSNHPSESDLALLAGGDHGWFRATLIKRHIKHCGDCQDVLASFGEMRTALKDGDHPEPANWDLLATEMRANIRVGLAAGECVRVTPSADTRWLGMKPQLAMSMAGVLFLVGAGAFLKGLLPHEEAVSVAHAAELQSTGAGVEVRTDAGASMILLNHGDEAGDQSITSSGAIRASYVDGNTGTVTVNSVYVE